MDKRDLYVGMRVVGTVVNPTFSDKYGIVIDVECQNHSYDALVEFDDDVNGHDGLGWGLVRGKPGHCYWVHDYEIEEDGSRYVRSHMIQETYDISYDSLF